MEMNKVLKNISVILECSFIGSVILYSLPFAVIGGVIVLVIVLIKKKSAKN